MLTIITLGALNQYNIFDYRRIDDMTFRINDKLPNTVISRFLKPNTTINRERYYILQSITYQDDYLGSGQMQNSDKEVFFYNNNHPTRVDSIYYYYYDNMQSDWLFDYVRINNFNQQGIHIESVFYKLADSPIVTERIRCTYDNLERLTLVTTESLTLSGWSPVKRTTFVYDQNCLEEQYDTFLISIPAIYYKSSYNHDASNRIIQQSVYTSNDSLSWEDFSQINLVYHPNDATTGTGFVEHLSLNYLQDYIPFGPQYGMLSNYVEQYFYDGLWYLTTNVEYSYNTDNLIISELIQSMEDVWVNFGMNIYYYDTSFNLFQVSGKYWDYDMNTWNNPVEMITFAWAQTTSNIDNTNTLPTTNVINVYPNPFRDKVNIFISSNVKTPIEFSIFNQKGQFVHRFVSASSHLSWDGSDSSNETIPSGIYYLRTKHDGKCFVRKILKIK